MNNKRGGIVERGDVFGLRKIRTEIEKSECLESAERLDGYLDYLETAE